MAYKFICVLLTIACLQQTAHGALSSSNCCSDMPQIISDIQDKLEALSSGMDKVSKLQTCPVGFDYVPSSNECYWLGTLPLSWDNAMSKCAELGGKLAHITSVQQTDSVNRYLFSLGGIPGSSCPNGAWIGMQRQNPDSCSGPMQWKFDDGTTKPVKYTNWYSGEPNCSGNVEKCVVVYTSQTGNWQWNDRACGTALCYLCQV